MSDRQLMCLQEAAGKEGGSPGEDSSWGATMVRFPPILAYRYAVQIVVLRLHVQGAIWLDFN